MFNLIRGPTPSSVKFRVNPLKRRTFVSSSFGFQLVENTVKFHASHCNMGEARVGPTLDDPI